MHMDIEIIKQKQSCVISLTQYTSCTEKHCTFLFICLGNIPAPTEAASHLGIYCNTGRQAYIGGRGGLMVNTSDSGSRSRGLEPHSGRRVVSLSKTYLPPPPPKVLVIPRKRWLRPNMNEKLFTRTLSIKPNQTKKKIILVNKYMYIVLMISHEKGIRA